MEQKSNNTEFFPYRGEITEKQRNVIKILSYTGQKRILQKHFRGTYVRGPWLPGKVALKHIKIEEKIIYQNIDLQSYRLLPKAEFEEKIANNLDSGLVIRLLKYTGITHNLNEHLKLTKEGICLCETDNNGSNFIVKIKTIWDERFRPKESEPYNKEILKYLYELQEDSVIA
jgi:hypothetical protein